MASDPHRFDVGLAALAQQHDGLVPLLRTLFSFLHRRTDLYVVDEGAHRPMGFAPGRAEALLLAAFRAFPFKGPDGRPLPGAAAAASAAAAAAAVYAAPRRLGPPPEPAPPPAPAPAPAPTPAPAASAYSLPAPAPPALPEPQLRVRHNAEGRQVPVANGGAGPGYWWTQTLGEASLNVLLDARLCGSAKDIVVRLEPAAGAAAGAAQRLVVGIRGRPPVIDGTLGGPVRPSEMTWSLEANAEARAPRGRPVDASGRAGAAPAGSGALDPQLAADGDAGGTDSDSAPLGKVLTVALEKADDGMWWLSALRGHAEVDATAVDSSQPVSSYDDETQAAIRKVMWDEDQRRKGLPTNDEEKVAAIVQRARALPGSPFLDGALAAPARRDPHVELQRLAEQQEAARDT